MVLYSAYRDFARGFSQISSYNIAIFLSVVFGDCAQWSGKALLPRSLSAHALNLHNRNPMQSHNMRSHKRDPTPQIIVAAPYPFSCLPISSQIRRLTVPYPFSCLPISSPIRRLTVILARLPHPVTLTVRYPSACLRLLGACFRLLDRGKAVRRESRRGPGRPSCYPASRPRASRCYW